MLKYINFALSFWLLSSLVGYFRKSARQQRRLVVKHPWKYGRLLRAS